MKISFKGKTALITGATRGIGKQLAADFEKLGAELILTGTDSRQIAALNKKLAKEGKKNVRYYCVDFLKEASFTAFTSALRKYPKIDICVNNAGINRINHFCDSSLTDWEAIIDANLRAPFVLCREVSRVMKKNGYGRIVNIASIFGVISREKRAIYSSSKSGLIGLTRSMAIDLAPCNILANCVSPGFVLTDLTRSVLSDAEMKELESQIPLGRLATPEDISRVVLFLASDLNTYISGQNIVVDGGYVNI